VLTSGLRPMAKLSSATDDDAIRSAVCPSPGHTSPEKVSQHQQSTSQPASSHGSTSHPPSMALLTSTAAQMYDDEEEHMFRNIPWLKVFAFFSMAAYGWCKENSIVGYRNKMRTRISAATQTFLESRLLTSYRCSLISR